MFLLYFAQFFSYFNVYSWSINVSELHITSVGNITIPVEFMKQVVVVIQRQKKILLMGNIKYDLQNMPAGEEWGDMPSAPRTFDILFFSLSQ